MARASRLTMAVLAAAATSGHVLYPALVALRSRGRRVATPPDPLSWPDVTVVVAAYNEADCIGAKVRDVLANGYPGALEVMVVADGDLETADAAAAAGATVITAEERLGKSQALNLGLSKVTTPVVVLSDANNTLAPGSIAALVRWFDDDSIGAVAGAKIESDDGGEDLYWRFESWLKRREWAMGSTIGVVGELTALRTDAWEPIPADIAIDDLWIALDLAERRYRVAYEPAAKAYEPPVHTLAQQWQRRTRNVAGALHVFRRRARQLRPKAGPVAGQIWGHRLVRYTVGPLAHLALVVVALRRLRTSWLARLFVGGHLVGVLTLMTSARQQAEAPSDGAGGRGPAPSSIPAPIRRAGQALAQGVFLDAVALAGLARYIRGDRTTRWERARR